MRITAIRYEGTTAGGRKQMIATSLWPEFQFAEWKDTYDRLQM
ncbi:MAG: hypothetical protein WAK17_13760 [Candidatus Nitrosopolaris sp.]